MYLNLSFYFNLLCHFFKCYALYHLHVVIASPLHSHHSVCMLFHSTPLSLQLVNKIVPFRPFCGPFRPFSSVFHSVRPIPSVFFRHFVIPKPLVISTPFILLCLTTFPTIIKLFFPRRFSLSTPLTTQTKRCHNHTNCRPFTSII